MHRIGFLIICLIALGACQPAAPATPEETPEPQALLEDVIDNLREVDTFRLLIEQTGAPFPFLVSLDEGASTVAAVMPRGEAQFEAPNVMFANVRLRVGGLPPISVDLFARGLEQWFRLARTSWVHYPIAEGFDPGELMRENSGFSRALTQLRDIDYNGRGELVDGTPVHHIRGVADGDVVNELLFGLLEIYEENVLIDVFVTIDRALPALLRVTIPDTATEDESDSVWSIEIYDYNEALSFDGPAGAGDDA